MKKLLLKKHNRLETNIGNENYFHREKSTSNIYTFDLIVHFPCSYFTGTIAEGAPVIPISAQLKYNIDVVCEYITKKIPVPERDFTSQPRLIGE